jgi:hypothetical protein
MECVRFIAAFLSRRSRLYLLQPELIFIIAARWLGNASLRTDAFTRVMRPLNRRQRRERRIPFVSLVCFCCFCSIPATFILHHCGRLAWHASCVPYDRNAQRWHKPHRSDQDPAWAKLQADGWTQQRLGEAMSYPAPSARKSVSQFLRSKDPAISMLRRFAKAAGVPFGQLVGE